MDKTYTVIAEVLAYKAFHVMAEDEDHALEIVRADHEMMDNDLLDTELQNVRLGD